MNLIMKKAQINQTFIFIFSLIIMALIAFMSIKLIADVSNSKCETEQIQFKSEIQSKMIKNKEYGNVQRHIIFAPCNAQLLCFIDSDTKYVFDSSNNLFPANFPLFLRRTVNSYNDGNKFSKNIFLYNGEYATDLGYYDNIRINDENKIVCIEKKGNKFEFVTNGLGKYVEILTDLNNSKNMFQNAILTSFSEPKISSNGDLEYKIFIDVNKFNAVLSPDEIIKIASKDIENIDYLSVNVDEITGRYIYTFKGTGHRNFLGIIPLPMTIQTNIQDDGEVQNVNVEGWLNIFST
jgi:hypothetical protein